MSFHLLIDFVCGHPWIALGGALLALGAFLACFGLLLRGHYEFRLSRGDNTLRIGPSSRTPPAG